MSKIRIEDRDYGDSGHHHEETTERRRFAAFRRISWGAIFAGAITSLVVLLLLNLLGAGIGLGTINPAEEANTFQGLGTGTAIWWIVSNLLALFAGGYVAGRLSGFPTRGTTMLHGFMSWCVFTLFSFWLLTTTVGSIINGVGSVIGTTVSTVGQGVAAVTDAGTDAAREEVQQANISFADIRRETRELLRQTEQEALQPENIGETTDTIMNQAGSTATDIAQNPEQLEEEVAGYFEQVKQEGKEVLSQVDKQALVNIVQNRTNLSEAEARQTVNSWSDEYQQAVASIQQGARQLGNTAEEVTGDTTDALASAAIWSFIALVVGAIASILGGAVGRSRDTVERVSYRHSVAANPA